MSLRVSDRRNHKGAFEIFWDGPTIGVDTYSGETRLLKNHVPFIQNMHLPAGVPAGLEGYALLDTTMDAIDNANAQAFGQRISASGTETYVIIQDDGVVSTWDSAGNAWVRLAAAGANIGTSGERWHVLQINDYLLFANDSFGIWKYDGTDFLPLGSKIINNAEATTDWAIGGADGSGLATSTTAAFGLNSITFDAMTSNQVALLTYDPTTLNVDTGLLLARDYVETDRLEFWIRVTNASALDTTNTVVRIETSSGNDFDFALSAWTDEDGTTITLADNTWQRVSLVISGGTEAGTYDHTSVDQVHWNFDTIAETTTIFIDQVSINYAVNMPDSAVMAVWNNVLLSGGNVTNVSDLHFAKAGGPDEYNALAFIEVNSEDGGGITALMRFFNQVFVGKANSCHSLGGSLVSTVYPNYNFEVLDVTTEHGVNSPFCIVEAKRMLWFPWRGRFYTYDGTGTQEIGDRILPDLLDHEETRLEQQQCAFYNRRDEIWYAYPGNGDTQNTRLARYNTKNGGWIGVTDGSAALNLNHLLTVTESGQEYLVAVDDAGDVMRLDVSTATDFDGTAIVRIYRLPWSDGGFPEQLKYWGDLTALFGAESSGTVSVRYRIADHPREFDAASFTEASTVALSATDTLGWVQIMELSRWIQIEFRSSAVQFDLQYPVKWEGTPMGRWA